MYTAVSLAGDWKRVNCSLELQHVVIYQLRQPAIQHNAVNVRRTRDWYGSVLSRPGNSDL